MRRSGRRERPTGSSTSTRRTGSRSTDVASSARSWRAATRSRSARARSASSARRSDRRLDPGPGGSARPQDPLPRPALPLHLADRAGGCQGRADDAGELHPRAAAGVGPPRRNARATGAVADRRRGARRGGEPRARRRRAARAELGAPHDRARWLERPRRRRRRVRLDPACPRGTARRRRVGRGPRLDERHLRQRGEADAAAAARARRRPARGRDRAEVRRMKIRGYASATDPGRRRRQNEDSYVVQPPLFAVADGMGGAQAGEIASRLAASALSEGTARAEGDEARVDELIQEANRRVYQRSNEDAATSGMGTTVTVALVGDKTVTIGHVGDSRGYLIRKGRLEQLTQDHSLVAELVRSGKLSPEEAETHPQRSVITRVLGTDPAVDVDTFTIQTGDGDLFLLCSDGLSSRVDDQTILDAV